MQRCRDGGCATHTPSCCRFHFVVTVVQHFTMHNFAAINKGYLHSALPSTHCFVFWCLPGCARASVLLFVRCGAGDGGCHSTLFCCLMLVGQPEAFRVLISGLSFGTGFFTQEKTSQIDAINSGWCGTEIVWWLIEGGQRSTDGVC